MAKLEIAVSDVAGARVALAGGADRVELCSALRSTGGLTPSLGVIEGVVEVGLPVTVLIRPRAGDFVYDPDEIRVMVRDIDHARRAGAHGVAVGALLPSGDLDLQTLSRLSDAADGLTVTWHRMVDLVLAEPDALVEAAVASGVSRLLTSGGATTAFEGIGVLGELVRHSGGRVQIVAGGGVRAEQVAALVAAGVDTIHASASVVVPTGPSGAGGGPSAREVTDQGLVVGLRAELS